MKRTRMRRVWALAAFASIAAVIALSAAAASGVTVLAGNLEIKISGHISPRALPKDTGWRRRLPRQRLARDQGRQPHSGRLSAPSCWSTSTSASTRPGCRPAPWVRSRRRTPALAMKACGDALIGRGTSSAQVQFPESAPFEATGPLLAFNGPASGGGGYGGGGLQRAALLRLRQCAGADGADRGRQGQQGERQVRLPDLDLDSDDRRWRRLLQRRRHSRSTAGGPTRARSTRSSTPSARTGTLTPRSKSPSTAART